MFKVDLSKLPLLQRVYYRVVRITVGIGISSVASFYCIPHIFPDLVKLVRGFDCQSHAVPEEYRNILNDTCKKFKISPHKVELCYSSGFDTVSVGTLFLPNGAVIALPRSFTLTTEKEINAVKIAHNSKPVDWDSRIGSALKKAIIPDNDHLKFVIAHELVHIKDVDFASTLVLRLCYIYGTYRLGLLVPSMLPARPFIRQVLMQSSIWLMGCLVYFRASRIVSHKVEYKADKVAARLGVDYCDSGISYMRNRLKLNRILRKMDALHGDEKYSRIGNEIVDGSHPRRTDRLKLLKSIKEELLLSKKSEGLN